MSSRVMARGLGVGGLCAVLALAGCTTPASASPPLLTYLGQSQVAFGATFDGTVIGGLSGISYDAGRQQ